MGGRCQHLTFQIPSPGLFPQQSKLARGERGPAVSPKPFSKVCPQQGRRRLVQPFHPRETAKAVLASLGVVTETLEECVLLPHSPTGPICAILPGFSIYPSTQKKFTAGLLCVGPGMDGDSTYSPVAPSVRLSNHRRVCRSVNFAERQGGKEQQVMRHETGDLTLSGGGSLCQGGVFERCPGKRFPAGILMCRDEGHLACSRSAG